MGIVKMVTHRSQTLPILQRGLCAYSCYTLDSTAGPTIQYWFKYTMRIICLRSYSQCSQTLDLLAVWTVRSGGWFTPLVLFIDYYVPQQTSYQLYLIDPHLTPKPNLDYYA